MDDIVSLMWIYVPLFLHYFVSYIWSPEKGKDRKILLLRCVSSYTVFVIGSFFVISAGSYYVGALIGAIILLINFILFYKR